METMKKVMRRMKNPKIFLAVMSGLLMILFNFGLIDTPTLDKWNEFFNLILGIGIAIGIFSTPEKPQVEPKTENE